MFSNALVGEKAKPTTSELAAVLSKSKQFWDALLTELAKQYKLVDQKWSSYSPKTGWSLHLKREKRNILYFSPGHGTFQASLVPGDKTIAAARTAGMTSEVTRLIKEDKRYPEGNAILL